MAADDTSKIAARYARALVTLAGDARALEAVEADLRALKSAIASAPALPRLFAHPLLSRAAKASAMDAVLAAMKAHDLTRRFVRQMALAQRLAALPAAIACFETMLDAARGEAVAEVISAQPLTAAQEKAVSAALARSVGKVRLQTRVDEALLGGLVVKAQGRMIDASLRSQLVRLGRALKAA